MSNRLSAIIGTWQTAGHVIGTEPAAVVGSDVYELLPGGHFLIHHVDVTVGGRPVIAIEVIGEQEPVSGEMLARSYDNTGAVEVMQVRIEDDGTWHFTGGSEIAPAARAEAGTPALGIVRSTLRVSDDGETMHALWERAEDGTTWVPWMEIHFTRVPHSPPPSSS